MAKYEMGMARAWGLALALAASAGPSMAQQPAAAKAMAGPKGGDMEMERFKSMDADGDGRISGAEFLAGRRALWDRWSSGGLMSLDSCEKAEASLLGAAAASSSKVISMSCASLDSKGARALTWEQFAMPQWRVFKSLDANGDGFLSQEELAGSSAGRGLFHAERAPKPPKPSASLQASMDRDLAASNAKVKAKAALGTAQGQPQGQYAAPAQGADHAADQSIAERIQSWLR